MKKPNRTSVLLEPEPILVMCVAWTGKHDLCKTNSELWSKVDITRFKYIVLFNKAKQTFSSVLYAILQCKKTDL